MHLNSKSHPYLVTYDTNNPENRDIENNTYLLARGETNYDYWFCQFSDSASFRIFPIDTLVPPDILERVKNKEVFLVLDNANECYYSSVDGIYQHIVIEKGIPESQIILVTGGFDVGRYTKELAAKIGRECIKVEWFSSQEFSVLRQLQVNQKRLIDHTLEKKSYPKKFLNFNRRWRPHRPALLALLHTRNLIKDGYVSFTKDDFGRSWDDSWNGLEHYYRAFPEMHQQLIQGYNVKDLLPLYVDTDDLVTNRDFLQDSTDAFYLDTYFSVVSETTYNTLHGADGRFLTEKIFKAIGLGHPFVMVAPPRSLELLRSLDYQTFSPWINEDYDLEQDDGRRMLMVVNEIERLSNLSEDKLDEFLTAAREICTHNYNTLMKQNTFIRRVL